MLSPVTVALALLMLLTQAATPAVQQPAGPTAAATTSTDPATAAFAGEAGLMLVAIKPASVADYELVIRTLQGVLAADTDASRREATRGWRVFTAGVDAKGSALYIHLMLPAVPGFDYRPSLLVDALVKDLAPDLLGKYQDAFAGPPSKLDLAELANMAIAPVMPVETKKPGGR
jgi:hypothetical protein